MKNPKCPYCGGVMDENDSDRIRLHKVYWYTCDNCGATSPYAKSAEEAYAAAMKRENKCKTYAEDFKEHFGHSWNNKDNNWQCRGKLYNDNADCVNWPRCDCEACWNEEMEAEE